MSTRTNENALREQGAGTTEYFRLDYTLSNRGGAQASPSCGKQAAMAAYNWQLLSLESCARLFRQHPEWLSA